jgi:transcriptional antiterminator RfaH
VPYVVVVTKPNHEGIAALNLQRQGFTYYYPRFLHKKPNVTPTIRPLFPRYIFVHIEQLWRSLSGTRGVSYLLMGEGGPQTVSDTIVDAIKSREDKNGLYQLTAPPRFQPGEHVKTEAGPFQGLPLIYEGMVGHERVSVLTEILGRMVRTTIEEKALRAA